MQSFELDLEAVQRFMAAEVLGFEGPVMATKFSGGQSNPTFLLSSPSGQYVLRRKPAGALLKSAHAVDREYRAQKALAGSDVPVAPMLAYCDSDAVIGSQFYIMGYVAGRTFMDPRMDGLTNAERSAVIDEMNRVLAALHSVDINAADLGDYGPPGNYIERQIARWTKQYRASETGEIADMDRLIAALGNRLPQGESERRLVHGDYRLDNLLIEADGTRCIAVLDWELSTIGHPYADLASIIMQWRMPTGAIGRGLEGVDRASLGLPSDQDFIDAYCARRGIDAIPDIGIYLAFCFFRMGAILQGVKKRAIEGNASDPEKGLKLGEMVPRFAEQGLAALDGV